MAKKEIEVANAQAEGTTYAAVQDGTQEQTTEAKVNYSVKNVKIHTLEEVDCYIGGIHYSFAKGKDASVPSDVAAILTNSQKAYRN